MKKVSTAAIVLSVFAATPAWAETVDPDAVLSDLRYSNDWKESRTLWDGKLGRAKARWALEMKVTYGITPAGRMMNCNVISPSGSAEFDQAACNKLTRESRFEPKLSAAGKPIRSSGELSYQLYQRAGLICGTGLDDEEQ
jgi:TonB family protein